MLIKVMYQNGKVGNIESCQLDDLINSKIIKKFQRSGKWVTIGIDPIRGIREDYLEIPKRQKYRGEEKKGE